MKITPLFQKAIEYEENGPKERGKEFTWCQDMSLRELIKHENIKRIKDNCTQKLGGGSLLAVKP